MSRICFVAQHRAHSHTLTSPTMCAHARWTLRHWCSDFYGERVEPTHCSNTTHTLYVPRAECGDHNVLSLKKKRQHRLWQDSGLWARITHSNAHSLILWHDLLNVLLYCRSSPYSCNSLDRNSNWTEQPNTLHLKIFNGPISYVSAA